MNKYIKRSILSTIGAFFVLIFYSLAAIPFNQVNVDRFFAIIVGALACCLVGGFISAALIKSNDAIRLILAQVISVIVLAALWRL